MTDVDLRERLDGEHRDDVFEMVSELDVGDGIEVISDQDIDPHLIRYQIEEGYDLEWEYADPDAEPRELRITKRGELGDGELGTIDVRDLKPQRRHEALLQTFDELGAGEGFVLINDHDPKPLYYELRSMHGEIIDWTYRSKGEDGWQVEIQKTAESSAGNEDVVTQYDVREIPDGERASTIHHRYGMIPEGGTLEMILSDNSETLEQEFREQYGDSFSWEVVEENSEHFVVQITKREEDVEEESEDDETGIEVIDDLDVRSLPPAQRHELIFEAYANLDDGEGFVLINDHDPKPLYHQFETEEGPEFTWEYRQKEPGEFRVLIGKAAIA
jgi:uncharacterized protein (DUF2249 family)